MNFLDRSSHCKNPTAKKLLQLMAAKKTNLALSIDLVKAEDILRLVKLVGDEICVLKTHVDIIEDFSPAFIDELKQLAQEKQFLIFEDRKFADIGNTVKHQYGGGLYHIAEWADIVNAHALPGPGIIQGLAEIGLPKNRGLLLLAQMSSKDNLFTKEYVKKTLQFAELNPDFVIGFIAQEKLSTHPQWITMTPGIQFAAAGDTLGQQYITPEKAIANGTDIIIVGRGIYQAPDPLAAAKAYRAAGWQPLQLD